MVANYNVDTRLKPVLYLVATLWMVTQQNVISYRYYQFLTFGLALVTLVGLMDVFEGLFIGMHHSTKLLVQPNSLGFKTS